MSELTHIFGNDFVKVITQEAVKNSKEFIKQSGETKLELVDKVYIEKESLKLGVKELVETLDEVSAENELHAKTIEQYAKKLGVKNEDFIKQHNISVVMTEEKNNAKKALLGHLSKKYGNQLKPSK